MGYFIRQRKAGWALLKTHYESGRCLGNIVPFAELNQHFFNSAMTLEEAREQAKKLNQQLHTDTWMKKRAIIQEKTRRALREKVLYLPDSLSFAFEEELSSHPDPKRMKSIWRAARKLIKEVRIPPEEWKRRKQNIYNYFEMKRLSPDYAKKIIRVMNMWGEFYSQKTNSPYSHLPCPVGSAAGRLRRTYNTHRKTNKASDGMTVELLNQVKPKLSLEQFNYMLISFWFGLRPQEMANLAKGTTYSYFDHDDENNVEVLNILQTKLSNLADEEQWKSIPILYPEQRQAASIIRSGIFKAPRLKTLKNYTLGNYHLYAGRKGFGPLMWGLGHDVVEVSSWLGHKSIDRTYRSYMKWKRIKLRSKSHPEIALKRE